MSKDNLIRAWVNPLICLDADDRFPFKENVKLTSDAVLEYLAENDNKTPTLDEMKSNYARISENATRLFIIPAETMILSKIIRPLRHALGYFMIGNFLESIAISGMVCEMAAVFLFQINEITVKGEPVSNDDEANRNLIKFEKMRQWERTSKLLEWGLIDKDVKDKFDFVSEKRNEYLHRLSKNDNDIETNAKHVFDKTLDIILYVTGLRIGKPGRAVLNQKVLDYLRKKGLLEKSD